MEVDEIQTQVRKFQRISSNGSTANSDNTSNPHKIATQKANSDLQNVNHFAGEDGGGVTGGGVARLCGWPSSRIVRVSRASGGKDRHSKVLTSKGLRDRRVRLSVTTAIQFYDLQDRLGYDQPSKAVEWLIKAASSSIAELPSLDPAFSGAGEHQHHHRQVSDEKKSTGNNGEFEDLSYQNNNNTQNQQNVSKSSACSSTSETSKGSGLSLSRSENRIRARERAREMAAKKEKEKEQNSSFTDLLTGGISSAAVSPTNVSSPATSPMDYLFFRPPQFQMPQFNIIAGDGNNTHHHHHPQHHFSFLQESFAPVVTTAGGGVSGGGESYNLNFSIASSSPGFNRGTLQSNLSSILPHHNHRLQRFQSSSMMDGSTSTNFPFFAAPTSGAAAPEHFPASGYDSQRLQLYGGGDGADHHKEKRKN